MIDPDYKFVTDDVSVDTETFYAKDYSVADMGLYAYVHDPRFECYLVTIACKEFRWAGSPKDAPWDKIKGRRWLSHSKGFDHAVLMRCWELGLIPKPEPSEWHCTANMCVFLQMPRNLKSAVKVAFDVEISKDVRDKDMKGVRWHDMSPELKAKVLEYADGDPFWSLRLWEKYSDQWPEKERLLSEMTYSQGEYGVYADAARIDAAIQLMEKVKFEAALKIPWRENFAVLSPKALGEECRKVGIAPPASLAKDDEACAEWEDTYGDKYPWVGAMRDYRRSNALVEKFKTMRERIMPNGRMAYSLLYAGAQHTLRWSGSGGFNVQNLPRDPFYIGKGWKILTSREDLAAAKKDPSILEGSADMRSCIVAAPGKKLVIADFAQIEARVTPWLAGDTETLALAAKGISVYEVHARRAMNWTGGSLKKEDPLKYLLAKGRVLGLGFQCGHEKFIVFSKKMLDKASFDAIFSVEVDSEIERLYIEYRLWLLSKDKKDPLAASQSSRWPAMFKRRPRIEQLNLINSWVQVTDFRKKNPKIVALWKKLDEGLRNSIGGTYEVELPSGDSIRYFNVINEGSGIQARMVRGEFFKFVYGGLITENIVQRTARNVFADAKLRVRDEGIRIVLDTHDEIVAEVDESFDKQILVDLMTVTPSWARGLPLGVEAIESKVYLK